MFIQRPQELVVSLLRKVSWYAGGGHMQDHIYLGQQLDFIFDIYKRVANVNSKQYVLSMNRDK